MPGLEVRASALSEHCVEHSHGRELSIAALAQELMPLARDSAGHII